MCLCCGPGPARLVAALALLHGLSIACRLCSRPGLLSRARTRLVGCSRVASTPSRRESQRLLPCLLLFSTCIHWGQLWLFSLSCPSWCLTRYLFPNRFATGIFLCRNKYFTAARDFRKLAPHPCVAKQTEVWRGKVTCLSA